MGVVGRQKTCDTGIRSGHSSGCIPVQVVCRRPADCAPLDCQLSVGCVNPLTAPHWTVNSLLAASICWIAGALGTVGVSVPPLSSPSLVPLQFVRIRAAAIRVTAESKIHFPLFIIRPPGKKQDSIEGKVL